VRWRLPSGAMPAVTSGLVSILRQRSVNQPRIARRMRIPRRDQPSSGCEAVLQLEANWGTHRKLFAVGIPVLRNAHFRTKVVPLLADLPSCSLVAASRCRYSQGPSEKASDHAAPQPMAFVGGSPHQLEPTPKQAPCQTDSRKAYYGVRST